MYQRERPSVKEFQSRVAMPEGNLVNGQTKKLLRKVITTKKTEVIRNAVLLS